MQIHGSKNLHITLRHNITHRKLRTYLFCDKNAQCLHIELWVNQQLNLGDIC